MEDIPKIDALGQAPSNIKDVQSKPTLPIVRRTTSHPTSSTSHHPNQPPDHIRTIDDWIQECPAEFPNVNEGVMKDLMELAKRYLEEIRLADVNHPGAVSLLEVLEHRRRFSLLVDGDSDLDRRLAEAPAVREPFVSNLTALVLVLRTGIRYFTPEHQQTLVEDTNRVVEQTSGIALDHLNRSANCLPIDFIEFLDATKIEIKSRIDNLYNLLPTARHLVESFDETEPRRIEEIGLDKRRPFDADRGIDRVRRRIRQLHSTITSASNSSSGSQSGKNSHRPRSNPSKSSTKHSSGSEDSPSIPSLFSDNGTHDSAHPETNTIPSTSSSKARKSSSEPTESDSTQASSSCKDGRTTFSGPTELKDHSCPTHGIVRIYRRVVQPVIDRYSHFGARRNQSKPFDPEQFVRVWHSSGQYDNEYLALIDTGSKENFILRSVVEDLELRTMRKFPMTIKTLAGHKVEVSECVQPMWKFSTSSRRHQEYPFHVVPEIPSGIDMVLGNIAREDMGIELRDNGSALIAHEDPEDLPTQQQEQQQRDKQARDATASQKKKRQSIEERHAKNLRKVAAAKASRKSKPVNPTSQEDAVGSDDVQQR